MWAFTQSSCFFARKLSSACKALVLGRLFICSIPERHFTKCTLLVTIYPLFNSWVEIDLKLFEYLAFLWRGSDYFKSNLSNARFITPKRATSLRGPFPRHCAQATRLQSKKYCSGREPLVKLWPSRPNRALILRPSAPATNALPLDQLAGGSISPEHFKLKKVKRKWGIFIPAFFIYFFTGSVKIRVWVKGLD